MDDKPKVSKAQREAIKKYQKKNPEATRYQAKKATAKNFILKTVTAEDLPQTEEWLKIRKEQGLQE